jgi:hypothetical protein
MGNFAYLTEVSVLLSEGKEPLRLDGMVRAFSVVSDYDTNVFPVVRLVVNLNAESYYKIQQDDNARFSITVKKVSQSSMQSGNTALYTYYLKDKIFIPLDKDKTPINNQDGIADGNVSIPNLQATFTLISEEDLSNNKKLVNAVLSNVDMESAILYLSNKFSNKPVIFEKPDNTKIYEQILFPPNNIIRSLKYLDTVYGIYHRGLRVFLDLNAYYIINKYSNKNVGSLPNTPKGVHINVYGDNSANAESLYFEDSPAEGEGKDFFSSKVHITDVRFINYQDTKNEFVGSNTIIVSQATDQMNKNVYGKEDLTKTRVYYNRYNNPYKEREILEGGKQGLFMVCTLDAVDIDSIACNQQYFIKFNNKNYSHYDGEYQIMKSENIFSVGTNGQTGLQSKVYFRKV